MPLDAMHVLPRLMPDVTAPAVDEVDDPFAILCMAAFDGVVSVHSGRIRHADDAFASLTGYRRADLLGMEAARILDAALLNGRQRVRGLRSSVNCRDGRMRPVEVTATRLGSTVIVAGFRDLSAQTDGSALHEQADPTEELLCTHDLDGRILTVNETVSRILGISVDRLQTMTLREILTPGTQAEFDAYLGTLRHAGAAQGKMTVLTADGRRRVWEYRNGIVPLNGASVVRARAIDVTEREEALRAARKSEERFRNIIENASDVIGILDPDGIIRYHSPSLGRALGAPVADLTGSPLLAHVHQDDISSAARFISDRAIQDDGRTIKLRMRLGQGPYRSFELVGKNVIRDGAIDSIIINARDVTERDLLERQLEQANRLAGLGRLAATVAHEFNNVLMGMQPFSELLQRRGITPAMLEKCGSHIAASIQRGKRVALDILRFTQPAAPILKPLNLSQWWKQLEPEIRPQLGNQIALTASFPEHINVHADGAQLAQVFTNLVNNARDAMARIGTLDVTVREPRSGETFEFGSVPGAAAFVQISVRDSGCGIAPEVITHVFDPLFTTKENGGTGLGLAVAHHVISRHQGYIFVESEVGRGTTFHVFLPRIAADAEVVDAAPVPPRPIGARRVLLVDDETPIIDGISALLADEGMIVESAASGQDALRAAAAFAPDVVVLDVGLPDMSGFAVARQLQQARPALPIIFATGHGDRETMQAEGNCTFLQKPFDLDELLAAIAQGGGEGGGR